MRRLSLCIAAMLVTVSCIRVDDFGKYWDRGVVDPALEGTWKNIRLPASDLKPEALRFTRTGTSYSMYADSDTPVGNARTLLVGKRRLLMDRSRERNDDNYLWSYEIRGRTMSEYWFQGDAVLEFLRTRHPGAKNIHQGRDVELVEIGTFDDEVFRILSEVADNPTYWTLVRTYEKASN
jgi:hypothetical protein